MASTKMVLAGFAVALAQATSPPEHGLSRTIQGRVVADETGLPLQHAHVAIRPVSSPRFPVLTNGDGRFAISVEGGRVELTTTKAGFIRAMTVAADGTGVVEIRLIKAAVLQGRVVDPRQQGWRCI